MAGRDVNVELGNTEAPDAVTHRKAALTLVDLADKSGLTGPQRLELLEMVGFVGWVGSGAPVETARIPEPPKVRDRTGGALKAAQGLAEAAPIDGHPGECSDRSASRPDGVSGRSRSDAGPAEQAAAS